MIRQVNKIFRRSVEAVLMGPESEYLRAILKHSDVHISIQKRITVSVLE